jgi:hypothetical protein
VVTRVPWWRHRRWLLALGALILAVALGVAVTLASTYQPVRYGQVVPAIDGTLNVRTVNDFGDIHGQLYIPPQPATPGSLILSLMNTGPYPVTIKSVSMPQYPNALNQQTGPATYVSLGPNWPQPKGWPVPTGSSPDHRSRYGPAWPEHPHPHPIPHTHVLDRGGLVPETPKSRAGRRTVRFPAELAPELRRHLEQFAAAGERGLVFVGPQGAPLRRSNFRPIWNAACNQAGVPGLHFHDLRHVGGTMAAATGASLKELMARLGHSSTRAAMMYQHATQDRDEAIAKALGGLWSRAHPNAASSADEA